MIHFKIYQNFFLTLLLLGMAFSSTALPTTVRFATEATYPPYVILSPSLKVEGFETELLRAICIDANLNCTFNHLPFDSLFLSLSTQKIDAVFGGIGITEGRKETILFSDPLYENTSGFIFLKNKPFEPKANLSDKTIAVQQGTTFEHYCQEKYGAIANIKSYASIQEALLDLVATRVDVVFGDLPVFNHWLKIKKQENYQILELPENYKELSTKNAIAFRKSERELVKIFNQSLNNIKNNGTYSKLKAMYLD